MIKCEELPLAATLGELCVTDGDFLVLADDFKDAVYIATLAASKLSHSQPSACTPPPASISAKFSALSDVMRAAQTALEALAALQAQASAADLAIDGGDFALSLQTWLDSVAATGDASVRCASLRSQREWLLHAADRLSQHGAKSAESGTHNPTPATLAECVSAVKAPMQAVVAHLGARRARAEAALRATADRAASVATEIEQSAQTTVADLRQV